MRYHSIMRLMIIVIILLCGKQSECSIWTRPRWVFTDSYVYVRFDSFCFISEKTPSILDGECAQGKKNDCSRLLFHCFSVANQLCFSQNSWGEIKIEALQTIVVLGFVSFNPLKPTLKHSVIWLIVYTFFTQHINLNIFSNILRWTLTGLKQLRLSWLSMHHFFF